MLVLTAVFLQLPYRATAPHLCTSPYSLPAPHLHLTCTSPARTSPAPCPHLTPAPRLHAPSPHLTCTSPAPQHHFALITPTPASPSRPKRLMSTSARAPTSPRTSPAHQYHLRGSHRASASAAQATRPGLTAGCTANISSQTWWPARPSSPSSRPAGGAS